VRKLIACGVGLVAALALSVPGAFGGAEQVPGVTARSVTIGGTFPLSGGAAAYAPIPVGMKAYFAYVNATRTGPDNKRGVFGRQIIWKYYDDEFIPANTLRLTRRLVDEDKVFATVGQLGTEQIRGGAQAYMNQKKVPQLLVSSGASYWGTQGKEYPWTIGWQPDYISEGRLYGLHIKRTFPGKKIAILYQNDDVGKDYLYGVNYALGPAYRNANVVRSESFELPGTNLTSQMVRIRASGAQVLVILGITTPTVTAFATARALGYRPEQVYMNSISAIKPVVDAIVQRTGQAYFTGTLTVGYTKDPQDPRWNNDAAMKLYREIIEKYGGGAKPDDPQVMYGVAKAETFVQLLYQVGKNLTRPRIMNAVLNMNSTNKFLLPRIKQKTGKKDRFIISQMQLLRQTKDGVWRRVGGLVEGRPR
jgi:branched-chain amino acid transport system substrate-binding protein